jgi:hypothetical protein
MTRFINRPDENDVRQVRVRIPAAMSAPIFQGWGPKF